MPTIDEVSNRYRLLITEPIGHGRRRLLSAAPAHQRNGRWVVADKASVDDISREPCALERPDGQVEEFGTGLVFDSRAEFLRARGACVVRVMTEVSRETVYDDGRPMNVN